MPAGPLFLMFLSIGLFPVTFTLKWRKCVMNNYLHFANMKPARAHPDFLSVSKMDLPVTINRNLSLSIFGWCFFWYVYLKRNSKIRLFYVRNSTNVSEVFSPRQVLNFSKVFYFNILYLFVYVLRRLIFAVFSVMFNQTPHDSTLNIITLSNATWRVPAALRIMNFL